MKLARRLQWLVPPLALTVALVVLWQVAVIAFNLRPYFLPGPVVVVDQMWTERHVLLPASMVTLQEVLAGFALGSAVGYALGLVMAKSPLLESMLSPILVGSQAIPKIALAPLFIVWFGYGPEPKILVTALLVFFPLVISTHAGMRRINPDLITLMRSAGAGRRSIFFNIELPSSLPNVFGGLQIASSFAVVGAVIGEFMGATEGLGYVITIANSQIDGPLLMAALAYLSIMGVALFGVLHVVGKVLAPWAVSTEQLEGQVTI